VFSGRKGKGQEGMFKLKICKSKNGGKHLCGQLLSLANVPDKEFEGIKKGWNDYYWKTWKNIFHLAEKINFSLSELKNSIRHLV